MQFIDEAKIFLKSGDGGQGCVSFLRAANLPRGGPDGGNGGRGGNVYIECVAGLNTLIDFRYEQHFKAKKGEHGKGRNRNGSHSEDIIIKVPAGTQLLMDDQVTVIADMKQPGQKVLLLKGGDGGFGNAHFKTSTNQAPRRFTPGWPGMEMWVWLKLKLLSDAGLVGLPNAGKSTLLSVTSRAKPKIADYPFTTLKPQLGVVRVDDHEFVLADLPGLIAGAHEGQGLGDRFLKHVERCGVMLHMIDGTQEDVVEAYHTIRHELQSYNPLLAKKHEVIALNKSDALLEEDIAEKKAALEKVSGGNTVFTISAAAQQNITPLMRHLWQNIRTFRTEEEEQESIHTAAKPHWDAERLHQERMAELAPLMEMDVEGDDFDDEESWYGGEEE